MRSFYSTPSNLLSSFDNFWLWQALPFDCLHFIVFVFSSSFLLPFFLSCHWQRDYFSFAALFVRMTIFCYLLVNNLPLLLVRVGCIGKRPNPTGLLLCVHRPACFNCSSIILLHYAGILPNRTLIARLSDYSIIYHFTSVWYASSLTLAKTTFS